MASSYNAAQYLLDRAEIEDVVTKMASADISLSRKSLICF